MHSFLMMGQSNMAGRGRLNEVPPIEDPGLFMMRNCRWQPLCEPVNYDRPFAGVSLAASFALRYIREHQGETAALIPCADGGSGLDEWSVGEPLFENAVFCARQAMRSSELTAVLWHQGEHDSHPGMSGLYAEKLVFMLNELRKEIHSPVPILAGGLPLEWFSEDPETRRHAHIVNNQLMEAAARMQDVYYVSAFGLEPNADRLHINAKSLRVFGERYYKAFSQKRSFFDSDFPEEEQNEQRNDTDAHHHMY